MPILRTLSVPIAFVLGTAAFFVIVVNPARRELPNLRQTINERRGVIEYRIVNKQSLENVTQLKTQQAEAIERVKAAALIEGKELDMIVNLERLAEKHGVIERLQLDEAKLVGLSGWRSGGLYMEIEGSLDATIAYIRELEQQPFLAAFTTLEMRQNPAGVRTSLNGRVWWRPAAP